MNLIVHDQAASMSASTLSSSNTVQNCARRDDKNHFLLSLWTKWLILQTPQWFFTTICSVPYCWSFFVFSIHRPPQLGYNFQRIYISVSLTNSAIAMIAKWDFDQSVLESYNLVSQFLCIPGWNTSGWNWYSLNQFINLNATYWKKV
jgi:hypothetical protein